MVNTPLPVAALPLVRPGQGWDLLAGIKVIDLTTSVAGPYGSMLLGDMGADVIKVERLSGDDSRAWGPPFLDGESLWFLSVNRNKRSIALDYATAEGLAVLRDLAALADVLIVNSPAKVAKKLGIDAASMRALNPRLVYVSITGFGTEGERAGWPCYDLIAEGYSGVMDLTGEIGTDAQKLGTPAADMLAGQDAAMAAIAALFRRASAGKEGAGAVIDISLVESMTRFLTCRIVPYLGSGELPRRSGGKDSVIAIYQSFETADEPVTLGLGNDGIWKRFWEVMDLPYYGAEPRFATNAARRERRAEIVSVIQEILRTRTRADWLERFRGARIPAGPINRVDQVTDDENLIGRGLFYGMPGETAPVPQVGSGLRIDGAANTPRLAPPRLGQHTSEILRDWLDYSDAARADLRKKGVI